MCSTSLSSLTHNVSQ